MEENRARYGAKRPVFLDLFARTGVEVAGSAATFYLWVKVPGGAGSLAWALDLLERGGVIVAPGSFFGPEGRGTCGWPWCPRCRTASGRRGSWRGC